LYCQQKKINIFIDKGNIIYYIVHRLKYKRGNKMNVYFTNSIGTIDTDDNLKHNKVFYEDREANGTLVDGDIIKVPLSEKTKKVQDYIELDADLFCGDGIQKKIYIEILKEARSYQIKKLSWDKIERIFKDYPRKIMDFYKLIRAGLTIDVLYDMEID
jgi:hypothetical protein